MNDVEKAIKHFKKRNFGLKANPVCQRIQERVDKQNYEIERNKLAISALEKQIPKKHHEDDSCPVCETYLRDDNDVEGDYCPNCGQAIDWSVE